MKISSKSVINFESNVANKLTDKQTNTIKNITPLVEVVGRRDWWNWFITGGVQLTLTVLVATIDA